MFKSHVVLKLVCPLVEQQDGAIAQDTAQGGSLDCHLGTTGHLHTPGSHQGGLFILVKLHTFAQIFLMSKSVLQQPFCLAFLDEGRLMTGRLFYRQGLRGGGVKGK